MMYRKMHLTILAVSHIKNISLRNFKLLVRVLLQLLEGLQVYIKNYIINVRKLCFNWKGLNILKIKISTKIY